MIAVKNLTKSFGFVTAVNGLTFSVKKGEIVGFLGPNGAGKTTTMRLITGFLSPDEGDITLDGVSILEDLDHAQKNIGYLPENNPLYKSMLVSEMFDLSADLKQIPYKKRKEAFDFAVSAVSIEDVFYRPLGELSKGYRQRVGMAMALMHRPKIIIMDEPTEGLDPNQRTDIRNLIKELAKDRTIILSTHVMQEAVAISNRILIINKGKLVADGTPEELTQASKDTKIITVELEGKSIKKNLEKLKQITQLESVKVSSNRYIYTLTADAKKPLQPVISELAGKHDWTIWQLNEKITNLEDVFQQLTQAKL